uniref:Uncharacterized protein n=1 Tax=Schizaphis graminum TaxID=13262 RepID=A0A2S2NHP8_SCHGA
MYCREPVGDGLTMFKTICKYMFSRETGRTTVETPDKNRIHTQHVINIIRYYDIKAKYYRRRHAAALSPDALLSVCPIITAMVSSSVRVSRTTSTIFYTFIRRKRHDTNGRGTTTATLMILL